MVLTITNHIEHVSLSPDTRAQTDVVLRISAAGTPRPPRPAITLTLAIAATELRAPDRVAIGNAVMSALQQLGPEDHARLCLFGEGAALTSIDLTRADAPHQVAQLLNAMPSGGRVRTHACLNALAHPVEGSHTLIVFGRSSTLQALTHDMERFDAAIGPRGEAHVVHVGPHAPPSNQVARARTRPWALTSPHQAATLMANILEPGSIRRDGSLQLRLAPEADIEIETEAYGHACRFTQGAVVIPLDALRDDVPVDIAVRVRTRTPREPGFQRLFHARIVDADKPGAPLAQTDVQMLVASQPVRTCPALAPALWLLRTRASRGEAALLAARGERDAAQACLRPRVAAYTALRAEAAPHRTPALEMEYALLLTDVLQGSALPHRERTVTPAFAMPPAPENDDARRRSQAAEPPAGAHLTFEGSLLVGIYELATHNRIGRDIGNDIVVESSRISRHHAEIVKAETGFVIEDRGSSNGTFVNGLRVAQRLPLNDGDIIVFSQGADTRVTFHASTAEKLRRPTREFPMASPRLGLDLPAIGE